MIGKFKYIIPILLVFFTAAGCRKSATVKPAAPFDTDLFVHQIGFNAPAQYVATSVSGTRLTMLYYENVQLFIPDSGYKYSFAIHLTEDFSNSVLKNFDYTTINSSGMTNVDYVESNLNDIPTRTIKDTVINKLASKCITVQRPFTFFKDYPDNKTAVNKADSILKLTSDKINFTSYVYFTKTFPATNTTAPVYYVKP